MTLLEPRWILLAWTAVPAALLYLYARAMRRRATGRLAESHLLPSLLDPASASRRLAKAIAVCLAVACMAFALARPAWNPAPRSIPRSGRDVVFLVDVSRSMMARDLTPNRLERAKLAIGDVLDVARGDQVAIIAFAGTAVVKCPLTTDYGFARLALDELSPNSVSRGGSLIGDAIRVALGLFADEGEADADARFRDVFLITDGEDHESFPVEAARLAGSRGVRIIAIGIGDPNEGTPVPDTDSAGEFLRYDGETVRSRLDAAMLREISDASRDGIYLNVATGNIELDSIYRTLVRKAERRQFETAEVMRYEEGFQYALAAALLLLIMEMVIRERRHA